MAYENVIADENTRPDTEAKVTGYLIMLRSYCFFMSCVHIFRCPRDYYTNIQSL